MSEPDGPGDPGTMGFQWSRTAETFMLNQLGHVVYFWKQGRQASFLLETQQNGEANLNLRFHLPKPQSGILPATVPASHSTHPNQPIPPLFPNGQNPRPKPAHPQQRSHPSKKRSPSYFRQNYRRGVMYRAAKAAPSLQTPTPNTLRDLATRALERASESTPTNSRKRTRSPSSPLNSRKHMIQVISETESPEQLRDQEILVTSQLQEISDTGSSGVERMETSLGEPRRDIIERRKGSTTWRRHEFGHGNKGT